LPARSIDERCQSVACKQKQNIEHQQGEKKTLNGGRVQKKELACEKKKCGGFVAPCAVLARDALCDEVKEPPPAAVFIEL
jgi:hypothetical protein